MGQAGRNHGFDVHVAGTVTSWEMYQMVYETLLTTDETMKLQPGLAESWQETSPTSYVFKLRPDAKFSNGRPVVASDVIGSLQRIKNPETASYWSAQLGSIAKMEAPDDQTVKVELDFSPSGVSGGPRPYQQRDFADEGAEGQHFRPHQAAPRLGAVHGRGPQAGRELDPRQESILLA